MGRANSRYRLTSSPFDRPEERSRIEPKRVIFLSVEGDETERNYFTFLGNFLDSSVIHIEVLRHKKGDGYCDPVYVIELLRECMDVRQGQIIPGDVLSKITSKYSNEVIQIYLVSPEKLDAGLRNNIQTDLLKFGIDIEYRRYLEDYHAESDIFAVVLDRDSGSHSREQMEACVNHCSERGFDCYVSNPCFEFWLLLHLCDIKAEFSDEEQAKLLGNPKISIHHTQTSREVSLRAHHNKHIPQKIFDSLYRPNIETAMKRAGQFSTKFPDLLDNLGTNIPELMERIGIHSK